MKGGRDGAYFASLWSMSVVFLAANLIVQLTDTHSMVGSGRSDFPRAISSLPTPAHGLELILR